MNRSSFALFVALLIHLILFLLLWILGTIKPVINEEPKLQEKRIKISLREMPKKQKIVKQKIVKQKIVKQKILKQKKAKVIKKKVEPIFIPPLMPKGSQLKKIVKKTPSYVKPKPKPKTVKKPKNKIVKKTKTPPQKKTIKSVIKPKEKVNSKEKIYTVQQEIKQIKEEIKLLKKVKEKPKNPLYNLLSQDKSSQEITQKKKEKIINSGNINQNIKELYGDKFGELTKGQQKYILDNQEIMRRITQQVLNRVARVNLPKDLHVNKSNVIEFYLHPNGDMTDFRFLKKSGYYVLDDTTKETIEYAYSRYPRPSEKTLIRYNVFYNLAY